MGLIDHQENMKVRQQFARGFSWDHHHINNKHCKFNITPPPLDSGDDDQYYEPSLSLAGCKRLRPLAPKLPAAAGRSLSAVDRPITSLDLKSFIRPDSAPRKLSPSSSTSEDKIRVSPQVETHPGGTRWNPTQEQIGILEMLYREGMRTPNAQQIEQITAQLSKYGKIEGKNVFYWFQNHKARERQKLKRNNTLNGGLGQASTTTTQTRTAAAAAAATPPLLSTNITPSITLTFDKNSCEVIRKEEQVMSASCKRMCDVKWTSFECCLSEENLENITNLITTSPRHHDHIVHPAAHNYGTDDQGEEGADKKTLDLFPLHPEGR